MSEQYYARIIAYQAKLRYEYDELVPSLRSLKAFKRYRDIQDVTIWAGYLDFPEVNINEEVYVTELDRCFQVSKKAKSTSGGVIYWSDSIAEVIEDEETTKTKQKAENDMREAERKRQERQQNNLESKQYGNGRPYGYTNGKSKWWKFWK